MPRKLTGAGARNKGKRAETELVNILRESGIPTQKVIASGAFIGAKGDLKVGVTLNKDGSYPDADESQSLLRAEVKNRKDNPEKPYTEKNDPPIAIIQGSEANELVFKHLNQDKITKCVIMKRAKITPGDLKNKNYNETHVVVMGLEDWMEMVKQLLECQKNKR